MALKGALRSDPDTEEAENYVDQADKKDQQTSSDSVFRREMHHLWRSSVGKVKSDRISSPIPVEHKPEFSRAGKNGDGLAAIEKLDVAGHLGRGECRIGRTILCHEQGKEAQESREECRHPVS